MNKPTDYELLMRGDREFLHELYNELAPKIRHWIVQRGGDYNISADVFQEVLTAIIAGNHEKIDNVHGFIFNMCKYRYIDHTRKNNSHQRVISELKDRNDIDESIENKIIEIENSKVTYQVLEDSLNLVSANCQELLAMVKEGKSPKEIVEIMDFNSVNTFYRRKFACLQTWKKHISEHPMYHLINNDGIL